MPKLGVGVGEDFPVDDEPSRPSDAAGPEGAPFEGPFPDSEARRAWRRERRAWRHQWRREWHAHKSEWKAQKRAFKAQLRESVWHHPDFEEYRRYRHWHGFALIPVFAVLAAVALLVVVFSFPLVVLAIALMAFAAAVWQHGHRRHRWHHYRDDIIYGAPPRDERPAPPPQVSN